MSMALEYEWTGKRLHMCAEPSGEKTSQKRLDKILSGENGGKKCRDPYVKEKVSLKPFFTRSLEIYLRKTGHMHTVFEKGP